MKITDKYVYFWGEWLSNFEKAIIKTKVNGEQHTFYSSEQYFMYLKAITFNDEIIAKKFYQKELILNVLKILVVKYPILIMKNGVKYDIK